MRSIRTTTWLTWVPSARTAGMRRGTGPQDDSARTGTSRYQERLDVAGRSDQDQRPLTAAAGPRARLVAHLRDEVVWDSLGEQILLDARQRRSMSSSAARSTRLTSRVALANGGVEAVN